MLFYACRTPDTYTTHAHADTQTHIITGEEYVEVATFAMRKCRAISSLLLTGIPKSV